jgi:hypothetical protein
LVIAFCARVLRTIPTTERARRTHFDARRDGEVCAMKQGERNDRPDFRKQSDAAEENLSIASPKTKNAASRRKRRFD